MTTEQLKRAAMHTAVSYAIGQAQFDALVTDMDAVVTAARADAQQEIDALKSQVETLTRLHAKETEKYRRRYEATEAALATVTGGSRPSLP